MRYKDKMKEAIAKYKVKYAEWIAPIDEGGISKDYHKEHKKPKLGRNESAMEEET